MLHIPTKRALFAGGTADIFRDDFNGAALNENLWTKTDTEGKVSVSGGDLVFAGGLAAPAWGDPALVSVPSWTRKAGLTIEWQITPGATDKELLAGFTDGSLAANAAEAHGIYLKDTGVVSVIVNAATGIVTPLAYTATALLGRIVCLAAGAYYYVSTDAGVTWKILWADATITTTPLYAFIESYNAALTASQARVYHATPKPPVYSGTPAAPVPTLGAELVVNGGFDSGANWTAAGWTIGSGVASVVGAAAGWNLNQTVPWEVGKWHATTFTILNWVAGPIHLYSVGSGSITGPDHTGNGTYTDTGRVVGAVDLYIQTNANPTTLDVDNVSVKEITLASTLTLACDPGTRSLIADSHPTLTAGTQCGHAVWMDDETAPAYGLFAYTDATNAHLDKLVNGTWTSLISAAATYGAGKALRIVAVGTSVALYYDTGSGLVQIGTTQTVSDAGFGTKVCSFSTLSTNSPGQVDVNV